MRVERRDVMCVHNNVTTYFPHGPTTSVDTVWIHPMTFERSDITKLPRQLRYLDLPYQAKVTQEWGAITGFETRETHSVYNGLEVLQRKSGNFQTFPVIPSELTAPGYESSLLILAELKCYEEVRDNKIELGLALLEIDKSCRLITNNLNSLARAVASAKKFRWRQAARHLKVRVPRKWRNHSRNVGGRWLELQYGWLPVLSDIHSLYGIAVTGLGRPLTFKAKGSYTRPFERTASNANVNGEIHGKIAGQHGVKCSMLLGMPNPSPAVIRSLGLDSPAAIVWDIAPFSLLADWIVPISGFLHALHSRTGLQFITGSWTYYNRWQGHRTYTRNTRSGTTRWTTVTASMSQKGRGWFSNRTVYRTFPNPSLALTLPKLESPIRMANATAFLAQLLR